METAVVTGGSLGIGVLFAKLLRISRSARVLAGLFIAPARFGRPCWKRSIPSAKTISSAYASWGSTIVSSAGEISNFPASGLAYHASPTPKNIGHFDISWPSGAGVCAIERRNGVIATGVIPAKLATRSTHAPAAFTSVSDVWISAPHLTLQRLF